MVATVQGSGGGGRQSLEVPTEWAAAYGMAGKEEETAQYHTFS